MRTLLFILNLSLLGLLAGLPDSPLRWIAAALGAVTAVLVWRLSQVERRAERRAFIQAIRNAVDDPLPHQGAPAPSASDQD